VDNNPVFFIVYLPKNISEKQAKELNALIKDYPEEDLMVGCFSEVINDYQDIEVEDMKKILNGIEDLRYR